MIFERDESDFAGIDSEPQKLFKEKENSEKLYNDLSVKKKLSKLLATANKHRQKTKIDPQNKRSQYNYERRIEVLKYQLNMK